VRSTPEPDIPGALPANRCLSPNVGFGTQRPVRMTSRMSAVAGKAQIFDTVESLQNPRRDVGEMAGGMCEGKSAIEFQNKIVVIPTRIELVFPD